MKTIFYSALILLVCSCSSSENDSTTTETQSNEAASFSDFLDKFKTVPAFPFQFDIHNLHTEAVLLNEAEHLTYYQITSDVAVSALHKFESEHGWVCFSQWREDSVSNFEVSIFDKKGELIDTRLAFPPNFSQNKYKSHQKIEIWLHSIEFIYTEQFSDELTSVYSQKFEIDQFGFTTPTPIPFWNKLPRELWSDLQLHTKNDKGNYEVEVHSTPTSYEAFDVIDKHIKTQVTIIDTNQFIYGISHSEQDDNDVVSSRFAFVQRSGFELLDVTDQLMNEDLFSALSHGMYERDYFEKEGYFRKICKNGNKHSFSRLDFNEGGFVIQSYGKDGSIGQPTLTAKWDGKQFVPA